jgi:hypothetical protein
MSGIARSIVCERKGKQVNRKTYAEWTSGEQFCCRKAKGDDANLKGTNKKVTTKMLKPIWSFGWSWGEC